MDASRKRLLVICMIILIAILGYTVWHTSVFRIVGTTPSLSSVPNIMPYVDINFNKQLSDKGIVSISPNVLKSYNVTGKTLRVKLRAMAVGDRYTISINNVRSGGKNFTKTLSFQAKSIAFEKLPEAVQNAIVGSQDPDDPSLLTNDILVSHLPYGDLGYNISYTITTKNSRPALVIEIAIVLTDSDYKSNPQTIQNTINQREQAALNYIRSLDLDPNKYDIQYLVPPH